MHYSYAQLKEKRVGLMDINDVLEFVAPKVRDAAIQGAAQLERLGIRHALAGSLAVGAHGYVRSTTVVDFLVGDEAFEHHGALVTFRPGVPIEVDGVRIDFLSPFSLGAQLEEVLDNPPVSQGLAVVPVEALIYMKLKARRRQDLLDVVELINSGINVSQVRSYLEQYAADLVPHFNELVEEALQR